MSSGSSVEPGCPRTPDPWPMPNGRAVRLVGPNPAMDRIHTVDALVPGRVHRSSALLMRAGGKSSIVARTLRRLEVEVSMYGFLGGPIAESLEREYRELGIDDRHTSIIEDTRVTTVVVEASNGRSTVLNELGPRVSRSELSSFEDALLRDLEPGDMVVCTGSLPVGVDDDCYGRIIRVASERGAFAAIDASGAPLMRALESAPWCVKCNRQEYAQAFGIRDEADDDVLVEAMRAQTARGSSIVIVTMGGGAFLAATGDEVWRVNVPEVRVVNPTGSGDTFFGGFIAAIWHGGGLVDALRDGTAGGVLNAAQLEAGLQVDATLDPYRSLVSFEALSESESIR